MAHLGQITWITGAPTPIEYLPGLLDFPDLVEALKATGHRDCAVYEGQPAHLCSALIERMIRARPSLPGEIDQILLTMSCDKDVDLRPTLVAHGLERLALMEISGGQCTNSLLSVKAASAFVEAGVADKVLCIAIAHTSRKVSRLVPDQSAVAADGAVGFVVGRERAEWRVLGVGDRTDLKFSLRGQTVERLAGFASLFADAHARYLKSAPNDRDRFKAVISCNIPAQAQFVAYMIDAPIETAFEEHIPVFGHMPNVDYFSSVGELGENGRTVAGDVLAIGGMGRQTACMVALEKIELL